MPERDAELTTVAQCRVLATDGLDVRPGDTGDLRFTRTAALFSATSALEYSTISALEFVYEAVDEPGEPPAATKVLITFRSPGGEIVLEHRLEFQSTVVTTQAPLDDWRERLVPVLSQLGSRVLEPDAQAWLRLGDALVTTASRRRYRKYASGEAKGNAYLVDAVASFRNATELDPELIEAWLRKAEAYEALATMTRAGGPEKSAIKAYAMVTRLDPRNLVAWSRLAGLLESADRRKAVAAYAKVTELDPANVRAWRRHAALLDKLGNRAQAAEVRLAARDVCPEAVAGRRTRVFRRARDLLAARRRKRL